MSDDPTKVDVSAKPPSLTRDVRRLAERRYVRGEELAKGGMGIVHSVDDLSLERRLARKSLRDELAHDEALAGMLVREARIMAQLAHPHIVPVHDIGVDDGNRIYFTMKRVEGQTLHQWVREQTADEPVQWDALLEQMDVVIRVCDALAFAHSKGVIHCDIKPANIMIGEFGQVYLMDWGVARRLDDEMKREGADEDDRAGTPAFMSPEQAMGNPLDERADVFAVGALLYFIVTGKTPYRGQALQVLVLASMGQRKRVNEVAPWLPPGLVRIIERAMAHEATDRYQSVRDLRDDLRRFLRGGDAFEVASFDAGEVIVRQGEQGDVAYIIERGRCAVSLDGEFVREMGPGEIFGEMAVLSDAPRTATVEAVEPATLRTLSRDALFEEIDAMKPWMAVLVRTMAQRLRDRR